VLKLAKLPIYSTKSLIYSDVDLAIILRNTIVHSKPEQVVLFSNDPNIKKTVQKIESRMKSRHISVNPYYAPTGNAFFPDKLIGYGVAKFVCEAVNDFAADFRAKIGARALEPTRKLP